MAAPSPALPRARRPDQAGIGADRVPLDDGWTMAITGPGETPREWLEIERPTTAAAALRALGQLRDDEPGRWRLDASDVHFRTTLPPREPGGRLVLGCEGLATIAEVSIDGEPLLRSENMFVAHEVEATAALARGGTLAVKLAALDPLLAMRRPRPRWRAPMIAHQQLRWLRTTLLGRTPGWSPSLPAVGPWRPLWLERRTGPTIEPSTLQATIDGGDGALEVALRVAGPAPAEIVVAVDGPTGRVSTRAHRDGADSMRAKLRLPRVARWWPHTHGDQPLYRVSIEIPGVGPHEIGRVGFRSLRLLGPPTAADEFRFVLNDAPVFLRGACWTPPDALALSAPHAVLREALVQARDAGMNLLRVVGSMTYESDAFHDLCDELGICVWQDLMFANMDYPEDEAFVAGVRVEVEQALARLGGRPSTVLVCGDSEGEQQAAMWGAPRAAWERPLFRRTLAEVTRAVLPGVPYWPSSASGGAFPHDPSAGTTSYYGVGAYLRPLDDARRSGLRFASECLAFANVPDEPTLDAMPGPALAHSATWKARSPRDLGAGWDFDDVRDAYVARLFGVDATALRWSDHERYLQLGRVATAEVMAEAFAEWRRPGSTCGGALVWFLRDLVVGAGWGVVDALGRPKAPYHALRRALAPVTLGFTDEGLAGLRAYVVNERPTALTGELVVRSFRGGETLVDEARAPVAVAPHALTGLSVAALLEGFRDQTYAYRFGPPSADLVVGTLLVAGAPMAQACFFPTGRPAHRRGFAELGFEAELHAAAPDSWDVVVRTRRFAFAVAAVPQPASLHVSDSYFHLAPGDERRLRVTVPPGLAMPARAPFALTLRPTNADGDLRVALPPPPT